MKKPPRFSFNIRVCTNEITGEIIAVYLGVRKGKVAEVRELADGKAFANYDRHGYLLGVELLEQCELSVLDSLDEADAAKQFLRRSVPVDLVACAA